MMKYIWFKVADEIMATCAMYDEVRLFQVRVCVS